MSFSKSRPLSVDFVGSQLGMLGEYLQSRYG